MKRIRIALVLLLIALGGYLLWQHQFGGDSGPSGDRMLISHKTAGLEHPENAEKGFRASLALDVDAIELDVHLVRDGRVVLHHDPVLSSFNCFAKGDDTRLIVAQQTVEALAALACTNYKISKSGEEYAITTLDRFLEIYRETDQSKKLLIEIKVWDELIENNPLHDGLDISAMHYPDDEVVDAVYAVLRKFPDVTNVQFNTFSRDLLLALREEKLAEESFEFGLLYKGSYGPVQMAIPALVTRNECYDTCWVPNYKEVSEWLDANEIKTFIPNYAQASSLLFRRGFQQYIMHDRGDLAVIPWTLNDEEEWQEYLDDDFDGILTDRPAAFIDWASK